MGLSCYSILEEKFSIAAHSRKEKYNITVEKNQKFFSVTQYKKYTINTGW